MDLILKLSAKLSRLIFEVWHDLMCATISSIIEIYAFPKTDKKRK